MICAYQLTVPDPHEPDSTLFEDVSFEIEPGEWVRFSGRTGDGKSTLFRFFSLQSLPEHGNLIIAGRHIERLDENRLAELRRKVGTCSESVELIEDMTVEQNLAVPASIRPEKKDDLGPPVRLLEKAGASRLADVPACHLSRGQRRLIGIVRALVGRPELIVVDGALGRLGAPLETPARQLVREAHERGSTIIVLSRYEYEADRQCQAEYEIHDGDVERFRIGSEDRGILAGSQ